jgi:KGK domain
VSKQFHPLADGEVVAVKNTCRVSELAAQIRSKVADSLAEWSDEHGVDGEVLRFGAQGWEKGKVRLHLSIEFCPDDAGNAVAPPQSVHQPSNVGAPSNNPAFASGATSMSAASNNMSAVAPMAVATTAVAMSTTAIELPPVPTNLPADSTAVDDNFELGTMSDISGEINLNLSDDPGGYVDFDLSAAMPDLNLEELVANVQANRPSLVEEVWSEIEQPNWPGVTRT